MTKWVTKNFDDFFDMLPTNTLSRDKLNDQFGTYQNIHYGDVLIKYPFCLDCSNNEIPYINERENFNKTELKEGDVVFADTAEDDTVGKCVEVLNIGDRKIVSGLHTYLCRPKLKMAPGYLGYFLNSDAFHNQLLRYIAGSKVSSVNKTSIKNTCIFYPESLAEQRRIAGILSSADGAIAASEALIEKYRNIKRGLLATLLQPKEGWKKVKLGECAQINRGGSPRPIDAFVTDSEDGINWIKIGDIAPNGKYVNTTSEKIIPEGKQHSREVHKGDFILSNSMSFGRPYILNIDGCIHDGWLAIQDYEETFDTDFLYYMLSSDIVKKQYLAMASGSTVLNLNKEKVAKVILTIPFTSEGTPDLMEQKRIASILSSIDAKINIEEDVVEKYKGMKKGLMEEMMGSEK
ncbi:MAG: restriction endonuclease subunit S [Paludibacteraceae bacterium]|nr:restriction endonuclease subunit S [Paludibacteraceae bacterium]